MAGIKLLPEIGTGLGSRRKAPAGLGFRDDATTTKKSTPTKVVTKPKRKVPKRAAPKRASRATKSAIARTIKTGKPSVNDALKLREGIMGAAARGDVDQEQVMETLQKYGVKDPEATEAILGTKLSENSVRYFLSETKNNPKKAMKLSKKFGY